MTFTIGYISEEGQKRSVEVAAASLEALTEVLGFYVGEGCTIIYIYHTVNHRPVFDFKGN